MEHPIRLDDLGAPLFLETPIYIYTCMMCGLFCKFLLGFLRKWGSFDVGWSFTMLTRTQIARRWNGCVSVRMSPPVFPLLLLQVKVETLGRGVALPSQSHAPNLSLVQPRKRRKRKTNWLVLSLNLIMISHHNIYIRLLHIIELINIIFSFRYTVRTNRTGTQ